MSLTFAPAASTPPLEQPFQLTSREVKLINLIVEGLKDEEISARLGMNLPDVRRLITSTYFRLHVSDRLELIIHALYYGIVIPRCHSPARDDGPEMVATIIP